MHERVGMDVRALGEDDVASMWAINEEGLPGTGQVTPQGMLQLLECSTLSLGCFEDDALRGFVVCLPPGTSYGSLNYAWFNQRFEAFLYVDRIAVSEHHRDQGVGSTLYRKVIAYANDRGIPIAAEVNAEPPNPGSMRFHHRFGFAEVGALHHDEKSVTMLLRATDSRGEHRP